MRIRWALPLCILGIAWAQEPARTMVHFVAARSHFSYSIPWDATKPVLQVPIKSDGRVTSVAIFHGKVKNMDPGLTVTSGDLTVRNGKVQAFALSNAWTQWLAEVGTVPLSTGDNEDLYFVTMEGDQYQTWHFNLVNPRLAAMVTLSYSWGRESLVAKRTTSKNFDDPAFADEKSLLERLTQDPAYGIPFKH